MEQIRNMKNSSLILLKKFQDQFNGIITDLDKTKGDVCDNFEKILQQMQPEPFRHIIAQYDDKLK